MKVLNLYAGLGGNRKLWGDEHDITAVELNPEIAALYKKLYPGDKVVVGDAHKYLLEHLLDGWDFIWASPPCQSHSRMMKATRHKIKKYPDLSLYQEIYLLKHFFKGRWVVENVNPYYEPLIKPTAKIGRHLFWSNYEINAKDVKRPKNFINKSSNKGAQELKNWLGIFYEGNIYYNGNHCPAQVLRNCVHPDLGFDVFKSSF